MSALILVRSDTGDGGWSLHAPGATDEAIATGNAPYLLAGSASPDTVMGVATGNWSRPDAHDYFLAYSLLLKSRS